MTERTKRFTPVFLIPVLFFAGVWLLGETGIYNDSNQYIAMHIHREPLYPFFLWVLRSLAGEGAYLEIARFFQNVLAAFSAVWLTACIRKQFATGGVLTSLICLILLAPHVITPLFSASGLVLSNGIISEALGLPLFYLFFGQCLNLLLDGGKKAGLWALLLALALSLTRGQMMIAILLWAACALYRALLRSGLPFRKRWKGAAAVLLCVAAAFCGRSALVRTYNLAFNGYFINNTFGSVGMLANVLYAADREDGERIGDEKARELFYLSFDLAWEREANYRFAPEGFLNRAAHLEGQHDALKFEIIEEPWRAWHDRMGMKEYIPENVESDRVAGEIMKSILPSVLGRWLYDYLALSACGLIRSVAVVHPLLNWYALAVWAGMLSLIVFAFRKNPGSRAALAAAFAVLAAAANVYATSLIIMCLSRYMIYGLPLFYIGGLLLLREVCWKIYLRFHEAHCLKKEKRLY